MRAGDPEDDTVAGLLRNLGELILQQLMPAEYKLVLAEPEETQVAGKIELEEAHCGLNHAEVSAFILDRWRLPSEITEGIRHHHHPELGNYSSATARDRAYRLHFATRAADLLLHPNPPEVLPQLHEVAKNQFQMSEEEVREFLSPLSKKIADFAALLQIDIGESNDYSEILSRASEELVNLMVANNVDHRRANEASHRAESEARHWRQEAVFDPLTKIFNRRYLESKMREMFERPRGEAGSFGLLFLDLDGFKPLNDRFGHAFGDLVLQKIASCLSQEVRQGDVVARYGGDEFCILTDQIDQLGLHNFSHRIWSKINKLTVTQDECEGKVGASIGSVFFEPASQWDSRADSRRRRPGDVPGEIARQEPRRLLELADHDVQVGVAKRHRVNVHTNQARPNMSTPLQPALAETALLDRSANPSRFARASPAAASARHLRRPSR